MPKRKEIITIDMLYHFCIRALLLKMKEIRYAWKWGEWRGAWYPIELSVRDTFLAHYTAIEIKELDGIEIDNLYLNGTLYQ